MTDKQPRYRAPGTHLRLQSRPLVPWRSHLRFNSRLSRPRHADAHCDQALGDWTSLAHRCLHKGSRVPPDKHHFQALRDHEDHLSWQAHRHHQLQDLDLHSGHDLDQHLLFDSLHHFEQQALHHVVDQAVHF